MKHLKTDDDLCWIWIQILLSLWAEYLKTDWNFVLCCISSKQIQPMCPQAGLQVDIT